LKVFLQIAVRPGQPVEHVAFTYRRVDVSIQVFDVADYPRGTNGRNVRP